MRIFMSVYGQTSPHLKSCDADWNARKERRLQRRICYQSDPPQLSKKRAEQYLLHAAFVYEDFAVEQPSYIRYVLKGCALVEDSDTSRYGCST